VDGKGICNANRALERVIRAVPGRKPELDVSSFPAEQSTDSKKLQRLWKNENLKLWRDRSRSRTGSLLRIRINKDEEIVVCGRTGGRSQRARHLGRVRFQGSAIARRSHPSNSVITNYVCPRISVYESSRASYGYMLFRVL
jgi:hypothetical protein